jgi:hypothetical protein
VRHGTTTKAALPATALRLQPNFDMPLLVPVISAEQAAADSIRKSK